MFNHSPNYVLSLCMHVMVAEDRVGQPPQVNWPEMAGDQHIPPTGPLHVAIHNATVFWSGVLLGLLLAFITSRLGKLRHHFNLVNRLLYRSPFRNELIWSFTILAPLGIF